MTPPRLCDLGESVPPFYHNQDSFPLACTVLPPHSCLGVSLFPLPTDLPLLSWRLEKIQNLATAPLSAHFGLGWQWDIVKDWKSTDFLPSASWTEVKGPACFPATTISVALPKWVPSFRNQSSHTCLPSYPGGGELSLAQSFPILSHCILPGHSPSPPCQASLIVSVFPFVPTPDSP